MIYQVIVDISNSELDKIFDYRSAMEIYVGMRVLVPFGHRTVEGFIIGEKDSSPYDVKDIISVLDDFVAIPPELISLAKHLSTQNLRLVDSLRLLIPSKMRGGRIKTLTRNFISINPQLDKDNIKAHLKLEKQLDLYNYLANIDGVFLNELVKTHSASTVNTLIKKGILTKSTEELRRRPSSNFAIQNLNVTLTSAQSSALNTIIDSQSNQFLLHGVTGSGKTEIYLHLIEHMLAIGKTAIMLVPEISLTPQMFAIFLNRFGDKVSLIHSGLSDGERFDEWRRLRSGQASIALGARSCIFAPLENLGCIIIDEEHDNSYIADNNPRYSAIDIARFRSNYNQAKLVLGSATPSLETYKLAKDSQYTLITLSKRINERVMPQILLVDMREELRRKNYSFFSYELMHALEETFSNGNQAMIFINRRGYAASLRCPSCGYMPKCEDCDVSLTFHQEENRLKCHYCGKQYHKPEKCPNCGYAHLKDGKLGTERVVIELQKLYPNIKIARMDNDTTTTKDAYVKILSSFSRQEQDILVGTQMIAKGHDFPNVTLVGILDGDLSLYFSDYRSNEKTFQLITQVAGRAGRDKKEGKVILQTYNPNHYVFFYAKNYDYVGFFEKESNIREVTKFPPYSTILRILIQSLDDAIALSKTRELYEKMLPYQDKFGIFRVQAMKAPIKKLKTFYRYQIMIWQNKDKNDYDLKEIYDIINSTEKKGVSVFTEINPINML